MAPSTNTDREARDRLRRYTARQQVHATQVRRRRRDNVVAVVAVLIVVAVAAVTQVVWATNGPGAPVPSASPSASASSTPTAGENVGDVPSESIAQARTWTGQLTLNDSVQLGIELDGTKAPQAASVLIDLIPKSFYEGTACHRMSNADTAKFIQCGSANGDGTGDAGFSFGPLENVPADGVYPTGTIAMARSTDPYSQSTQFFITYGDTTLDGSTGGYTVVGRVTSGLDQLEADVTDAGLTPGSSETDGAPVVATTITGATIE